MCSTKLMSRRQHQGVSVSFYVIYDQQILSGRIIQIALLCADMDPSGKYDVVIRYKNSGNGPSTDEDSC